MSVAKTNIGQGSTVVVQRKGNRTQIGGIEDLNGDRNGITSAGLDIAGLDLNRLGVGRFETARHGDQKQKERNEGGGR